LRDDSEEKEGLKGMKVNFEEGKELEEWQNQLIKV
jgi:hypothetical protein